MKVRFGVDVLNNPQAWDSLVQIVDYFITARHLCYEGKILLDCVSVNPINCARKVRFY
jgi:hypothetical protein